MKKYISKIQIILFVLNFIFILLILLLRNFFKGPLILIITHVAVGYIIFFNLINCIIYILKEIYTFLYQKEKINLRIKKMISKIFILIGIVLSMLLLFMFFIFINYFIDGIINEMIFYNLELIKLK